MTTCIVFSGPNIAAVAADTRVSHGPSSTLPAFDGEIPANSGLWQTPLRFRKIRKCANGWAAVCGDLNSARPVAEWAMNPAGATFVGAQTKFAGRTEWLIDLHQQSRVPFEELEETVIFFSPLSSIGGEAWSVGVGLDQTRTHRSQKNIMNLSSRAIDEAAAARLNRSIIGAFENPSIFLVASLMADAISLGHAYASHTGPIMQFGATQNLQGGITRSVYWEGQSSALKHVSPANFESQLEILNC